MRGVLGHHDPAREPEAAGGGISRERGQGGRGSLVDLLAGLRVVAAVQDERLARLLRHGHHHRGLRLGERRESFLKVGELHPFPPKLRGPLRTQAPEQRRGGGVTAVVGHAKRGDGVDRKVSAVVGAGDDEQLNQLRQEGAAGAEVELDVEEWGGLGPHRLGQRGREVHRSRGREVGGPAAVVAGIEAARGRVSGFPGIGGDAREGPQAIQIDLVARHGVG